jgi:hypothetical protein
MIRLAMGYRSSSGRCAPSRHPAEDHPQVLIIALEQALESVQGSVQVIADRLGVPCPGWWNRGLTDYGLADWRVHKLFRITGDRRWKMIADNIEALYDARFRYEEELVAGANGHPAQSHWRSPSELTEDHLTAYLAAAQQVCTEMAMLSSARRRQDRPLDNLPS